ncbi:MAG: PqqD family peptide modification chaperone [Nitrososphaerales archaeon]
MEEEKLFKKGEATKADDGSLVLVNEDQTAYKVDEVVLIVWDMCNGISFREILNEITDHSEQDASFIRTALEDLMIKLQENKLIDIKQP